MSLCKEFIENIFYICNVYCFVNIIKENSRIKISSMKMINKIENKGSLTYYVVGLQGGEGFMKILW